MRKTCALFEEQAAMRSNTAALWRWAEETLNIITEVMSAGIYIYIHIWRNHLIKQNLSSNCLFKKIVLVSPVAELINPPPTTGFISFSFNSLWTLQIRPSWIRGVVVFFFFFFLKCGASNINEATVLLFLVSFSFSISVQTCGRFSRLTVD